MYKCNSLVQVFVPQPTRGGPKDNLEESLLSSTMWLPGVELRPSGLMAGALRRRHLTGTCKHLSSPSSAPSSLRKAWLQDLWAESLCLLQKSGRSWGLAISFVFVLLLLEIGFNPKLSRLSLNLIVSPQLPKNIDNKSAITT